MAFIMSAFLTLRVYNPSAGVLGGDLGPRSRCYGRTAALKAYCDEVFLLFHFNGALVELN